MAVLETEKAELRAQLIKITNEFGNLKKLFDQSRSQLNKETEIYQDTVLKLN